MRNFRVWNNGDVSQLGTNAKMSEVSAAMGLRSLEYLGQTKELNRRNYYRYEELLATYAGIQMRAPVSPQE